MRWFGEDPWGEETGEEEPCQLCLREDLEGEGGMRTLEQEVSEEDAAKMNYKGKWIRVEAEMDTGACVPMMPKNVAKHSICPSESRKDLNEVQHIFQPRTILFSMRANQIFCLQATQESGRKLWCNEGM